MAKKQRFERGGDPSALLGGNFDIGSTKELLTQVQNLELQTPLEYNGGQLDKLLSKDEQTNFISDYYEALAQGRPSPAADYENCKYLVGLDWCELSLRGDFFYLEKTEEYTKGDFTMVRSDISSRHFSTSFSVYYRNELFGLVLFKPRSAVIPLETIQFKVDNQYFYKEGREIRQLNLVTKLFLDAFELTFHNFTRLDIYIDFIQFNPTLSFEDFVHRYSVGQIETKGRISKWNPFYSKIQGKMELTGFSMGSRASDKFIRCYNKTLEITESHKDYISKYWKSNGMPDDKTIYRFELQLSSKFFKALKVWRGVQDIEGAIADKVHDFLAVSRKDTLLSLLDVGLKNYFEFFFQDDCVRNDDKIPFVVFDWPKVKECVSVGVKNAYKYVRDRIRHKRFTWRQKMLVVRNLFREYVMNFQDDSWLKPAVKIVYDYGLMERWDKMWFKYAWEFLGDVPYRYVFNAGRMVESFSGFMSEFKVADLEGQSKTFKQMEISYDPYWKAYRKN